MAFTVGKLKIEAHRDRSLAWREEGGEWEGGTNESDEAKTNFANVGQAPKFLIHKLSFLHPWPLRSYRVWTSDHSTTTLRAFVHSICRTTWDHADLVHVVLNRNSAWRMLDARRPSRPLTHLGPLQQPKKPAHFPPAASQLPYRVQAGRLHEARILANQGALKTSSFKAI